MPAILHFIWRSHIDCSPYTRIGITRYTEDHRGDTLHPARLRIQILTQSSDETPPHLILTSVSWGIPALV